MESFDQWFWGEESVFTRKEKSQNFLKQYGKDDNTTLRYYRYFHCLWFIANEAISLYTEGTKFDHKVKFKTDWGWWLYGAYVCVIAFAHYRHETQGKPLAADSSSPFNLWKVCT